MNHLKFKNKFIYLEIVCNFWPVVLMYILYGFTVVCATVFHTLWFLMNTTLHISPH